MTKKLNFDETRKIIEDYSKMEIPDELEGKTMIIRYKDYHEWDWEVSIQKKFFHEGTATTTKSILDCLRYLDNNRKDFVFSVLF